jgi:chromosome segregation ATPase
VITPDLVTEIASAYPGLQSLNLSSNEIRVVENLEPLVALESLDLRQNSIHTLDGVGQLPALKQLDVSGNRIQRCARCHGPLLEELNLADNQLSDWSQLESIGWGFPQLRRLQLTGNPICEDADYRLRVAQLVPTLDQLDGTDLAEVMGAGGSAARATRSMRPVAAAAAVPPPAEVAIADTPGPETGNGEATTDATNIELIQRLRDTVASLEADSNKMLQSLQDAEAQGDEAEERATDAMVRHTELESENEQLRREVDTCGVEKLKLESALRETTNKMQLCAAETQAVQQVLADTERDSLRYREEQQRLTDSAEQLRHELALARRAAEDLAETNATLKQQLQQTRQQQQQQQLATGDVSTKQRLQQLQDTHQNTLAYVAELEQKVGSIAEAQQSAQAAAEQAATAAAAEIQSLNAACRQLQINHEQDKDRSLVLEDTINMLQRRLREVSEQSVHVHADLQTTQESLEQAQAALVKSRDHAIQTVGLHDENLMLRQQLEEAKTRAVQIEDTLEFTRQSLIDAEHALEKTKDHVKLCGELEHENSRLRSNLSEVQTSLEHAHGGMAQLRESCDKSQRQLIESEKRTEEQLAVLSEQLAVAKERAALAAAQQQGSVSQVAVESQREKQSHAATMKQLEAAVAELACQKEVVAQRTSIVAATTTDLEAVLSDLHAELSNLQKENHSLRTQLTESNRRGEALSDVQEQKLLLQSKLKHAQDSAQINGIVQASQKSLREAEESFRQVIEESLPSAALKAEHSTLKKENVQLHNELVDLRAQLAEAHAKAGAIGSVLDTTTASLRAAEQSLCDSRASATALFELQQENQSLKSQLEAGAQDYKSTQQLIEENQQLQQKLYGHEKACHEAERQVFALQQQNEAAIDEQNGLRDQLQHATNISIEVQTVLDTTKHSLDSAEKALLQSKEQSLKLQDQLGQAQEALGQSHKQCDDLNLQLQAANASAGQRKNQLQSLESSRTRDQAELKQLRVHVANSAELQAKVANYSTRSTDVANSEAGDYTRLVEEISLLNIQVESMGHVLRLLEEELASHGALVGDHAKKVAVEQLLSKWRDKVLSLLVQQKSADVAHQQTIATMEQQWMQGQAEVRHYLQECALPLPWVLRISESIAYTQVAHLTTSVKVLKQTEVTLRAEIERANNRAQHAEASLKDGTRVRESAAANLEKEKINIQHLAAVLRTKLEEIQAMEQRLQSAACVIHGYGDRVQFAVGRITMMQVRTSCNMVLLLCCL